MNARSVRPRLSTSRVSTLWNVMEKHYSRWIVVIRRLSPTRSPRTYDYGHFSFHEALLAWNTSTPRLHVRNRGHLLPIYYSLLSRTITKFSFCHFFSWQYSWQSVHAEKIVSPCEFIRRVRLPSETWPPPPPPTVPALKFNRMRGIMGARGSRNQNGPTQSNNRVPSPPVTV